MVILPAIDLYDKKAVRLFKGDYKQMTVYSDKPWEFAREFYEKGAKWLHLVDLEGAKDGTTPNLETIKRIVSETGLLVEVGGGIRNMEVVEKYISIGVSRVILGTAAVKDPEFLKEAVTKYGEKVAVGVDIKDELVAIKGWTEVCELNCFDFCGQLEDLGVKTVICTDISKDGALKGTNLELYRRLSDKFKIDFVASGGVTTIDDVAELKKIGVYGAILGKALYTNNIDLKEAVELCKEAAV
ncbi:MAG: 1-(5-phosphoribosyl)-5-[Clostridia bacterium]|nr:1-(5-phosphoribosyl)-5-[(5-phosphoribosylamino)methylideneamino]imidazole-4-carboxamide isomerase [Clostridia bacterium]